MTIFTNVHTTETRARFRSLLDLAARSASAMEEREVGARMAGDEVLADALARARIRLLHLIHNIRLAEVDFLLSTESTDDALAKLTNATNEAKSALQSLQNLGRTSKGCREFLQRLQR